MKTNNRAYIACATVPFLILGATGVSCKEVVGKIPDNPGADKDGAVHSSQPNILFIITDDQPYNTIGCWEGSHTLTPNIDRLAREGMVFNRAYSPSSISAVSRYCTLTGRYAGRCTDPIFIGKFPQGTPHRIDNVSICMEPELPTLQRILQSAGYYTGMVGKWHLGQKFDNNLNNRKVQWEKLGLQYYDQKADPADPVVREALINNHNWYARKIQETGFDFADNIYWGNLKEVYNDHLNFHNVEWSVEGADRFIDEAGERPFFLYFSTTLHHGPVPNRSLPADQPDRYRRVTGEGLENMAPDILPDRSTIYERLRKQGYDPSCAASLWLDDAVGALLQKLEESGKLDNTIIFYFSDHGIDMKASMYEGGVRIPMIVYGKNMVKRGSVCNQLVSEIDLAPTCLALAGIPQSPEYGLDGNNILPLFQNPSLKVHDSVFSEIGYARCVATDQYKYIAVRYPAELQKKIDDGTADYSKFGYVQNMGLVNIGKANPNYYANDQLYDLKKDPQERHNLADDPAYAKVLAEMKAELSRYLTTFEGRPFYEFYDGK